MSFLIIDDFYMQMIPEAIFNNPANHHRNVNKKSLEICDQLDSNLFALMILLLDRWRRCSIQKYNEPLP